MPLERDFAEDKVGPPSPGNVRVFVGPHSVTAFKGTRIPLDGRKYACDGRVIFRNGTTVRAKFNVDTTDFDFLVRSSVICYQEGLWYRWNEPELFAALGTTAEDALPFEWAPDRPLLYHLPGPYPMERKWK